MVCELDASSPTLLGHRVPNFETEKCSGLLKIFFFFFPGSLRLPGKVN
jgi:hypothetical protein